MSALRLSASTWDGVPYDRTGAATIVHLGVGAFARAHLGSYADDLCRAGVPALIRGVSILGTRAEEQLGPQDGLYALLVREPGEAQPPQVLGAFASVATGRAMAAEAIAAPTTRLVTLTVTEKAYAVGEAPAVVADGLARRDRSLPPPVVASLDNVAGNGALLRERVLEASGGDAWIAEQVRFPSSVVDRMVPATTTADLDEVERGLGLRDDGAVVAERHRSWVLEGVDGLPPLADVGVQVVADVGPFQQRKLWLLNGPHSALAYAGLLVGCETIAEAAVHPLVSRFVAGLVEEVLEVAEVPDARAFAEEALRRFRNPALGHTCLQVGADGSQKLPQRIVPVIEARRARGLGCERLELVVALWSASVNGQPVAARRLPKVDDPARSIPGLEVVPIRQEKVEQVFASVERA